MECHNLPDDFPTRIDNLVRSDGLHLSDVIQDLGKTLQMYPWDKERGQDEELRKWFMGTGFVWEQVVSQAFADDHVHRPPEVTRDGIAGSPDGVGMDDFGPVLYEYKCSWRRPCPPTEVWHYTQQVMGYLAMLGLNRCVMHILYVCGLHGRLPMAKSYLLTFTTEEIESTWAALIAHAKERGML